MPLSNRHHTIPIPAPLDGGADPKLAALLGGFLAGPENRLAEGAVYGVLGGIPFFVDSDDSAALFRQVRREKKSQSSTKNDGTPPGVPLDSPFFRPFYPLCPEPDPATGAMPTFPPVIDFVPAANQPNFSPLIFYGPAGSGKSHLARGIFSEYGRLYPQQSRLVLTGGEFHRSLTRAIDAGTTADWGDYFARLRLVVIDPLEEGTEYATVREELVTLLDRCWRAGTLMIFTMNRLPEQIDEFSSALRSRLGSGVLVPVAFPAETSRRILVERFAESIRMRPEPPVLDFLTHTLPPSVSGMYGAFLQMAHLFGWPARPPSIPQLATFLEGSRPTRDVALDDIAKASAKQFGVKISELRSPSRRKTVVLARNMAIHLARNYTDTTLSLLGAWFGGRDHTTIGHSQRAIESRLIREPGLVAAKTAILQRLKIDSPVA